MRQEIRDKVSFLCFIYFSFAISVRRRVFGNNTHNQRNSFSGRKKFYQALVVSSKRGFMIGFVRMLRLKVRVGIYCHLRASITYQTEKFPNVNKYSPLPARISRYVNCEKNIQILRASRRFWWMRRKNCTSSGRVLQGFSGRKNGVKITTKAVCMCICRQRRFVISC